MRLALRLLSSACLIETSFSFATKNPWKMRDEASCALQTRIMDRARRARAHRLNSMGKWTLHAKKRQEHKRGPWSGKTTCCSCPSLLASRC